MSTTTEQYNDLGRIAGGVYLALCRGLTEEAARAAHDLLYSWLRRRIRTFAKRIGVFFGALPMRLLETPPSWLPRTTASICCRPGPLSASSAATVQLRDF